MAARLGVLQDVAKWPASLRMAVDGIATVLAMAMQLALERRRNLGGDPALQAELAACQQELRTLRTQFGLQCSRLKEMPPKKRPHFKPECLGPWRRGLRSA